MHFRRSSLARFVWALSTVLAVPAASRAEPRQAIDLEPVTYFAGTGDVGRTQISVLGYTYGYRFGSMIASFGGGLGFFTVQARVGITWLPGDLYHAGLMVRLDVRPQLLWDPCLEPLIVGSLGAGYRWSIEHGDPGVPGTAMYLLPAVTGGVGFLHGYCGESRETPLSDKPLIGGTLSGGFDW